MSDGKKNMILRIPKSKVILWKDEYMVVDFGDAEKFLEAVMASIAVSDKGKCIVLEGEKE